MQGAIMDIYHYILKVNHQSQKKTAVSITMNNGQVISYTYSELFEKADRYVSNLETIGVRKGDRIVIATENSPEWQMAFLAVMKLGATAVLIDASLGGEDLSNLIYQSDSRAIYASDQVKEKIGEISRYRVPVLSIKEGKPFKDSYKVLSPFIERTVDPDPEVAVIIYSSGTTRSAAGIMHTHEAMIHTIRMTARENELSCSDRILSILPNSHIYGVVTCLLGSMMLGASLHYVESISNENILSAFKTFRPTVFPCVPKVFELFEKQIMKKIEAKDLTKKLYERFFPICMKVREQTGLRLGKFIFRSVHKGFGGRLSLMTSAGAPLDEKVAAFYYGMGFDLLITYGLTETNIPIIGNRGDHITMNSCGLPYPDMDIQLAHPDETGEGEIYIRSPYMMKGYFRDEAATQAAFDEEGWFKTGDLARLDAQGNVQITGRSKENIVLATGKKVAPVDIETHYTSIPGIEELVISGVPISGDYDEVHAFVVKETTHLDEQSILKAIQERGAKLSQYMKVAKVHFLEEIPKTSLQKPKRYLLKKHALEKKHQENEHFSKGHQKEKPRQGNVEEVQENTLSQIEQYIIEMIVQCTNLDKKLVTLESKLLSEVGIDSLSAIEVGLKIEAHYQVMIQDLLSQDLTIKELANATYLAQLQEKTSGELEAAKQEITVHRKRFGHYMLFKASCILAQLIYGIKVKNQEVLPEDKGYIICANHVSNLDYLWVTQGFDQTRFSKLCCMAKKELFKNTFLSNLLRDVCGMIPVERGAINFEVMTACKKQLEDKWGLLIHPEGTRSHDGKLGAFKKGAATIAIDANVPIIPTYIKGGHDIFPRDRKLPKLFNWEMKRRYEVEVIYGEPIEPEGLTAEHLIEKVECAIKGLMLGKEEEKKAEEEVAASEEALSEAFVEEEMTLKELLKCDYEIDLVEQENK